MIKLEKLAKVNLTKNNKLKDPRQPGSF